MAVSSNTRRLWAWLTALRALLMLVAGIYAVIFPAAALTVLVLLGGALLLIDGVLGLWSLTFGGATTQNFWFDVVRNVLSLILGVLILLTPILSTLIVSTFIIYLFAFQAIIVGVMEIVLVIRERESYARIWPVLLSGALYVLFGIALVFFPLLGALTLTIVGGILMIVFAIALFGLAWRMYQSSKAAAGTPKEA